MGFPSLSLTIRRLRLLDWIDLCLPIQIQKHMTREARNSWIAHLLPVLDEFVISYKGNANHGFWQSMSKLRRTGGGSGSHSFISDWIQLLFPYLKSGHFNTRLKPWNKMSAPVDWDYKPSCRIYRLHPGPSRWMTTSSHWLVWILISEGRNQGIAQRTREAEAQMEPLNKTAPWFVAVVQF